MNLTLVRKNSTPIFENSFLFQFNFIPYKRKKQEEELALVILKAFFNFRNGVKLLVGNFLSFITSSHVKI